MKIKFGPITDTNAELQLNEGGGHTITIHCEDVTEDAFMVARAINLFPALVGALTLFRSNEMGNLLIGLIDMREETGAEIHKRLSHVVGMIDVILDVAEAEYDEATTATDA
jgi:hypothetical protein